MPSWQPAGTVASMGKDIIRIALIALIRGFILQQPFNSGCPTRVQCTLQHCLSPGSRAGPGRGLPRIQHCFLTSVNKEPLNYTNAKLLQAVLPSGTCLNPYKYIELTLALYLKPFMSFLYNEYSFGHSQ